MSTFNSSKTASTTQPKGLRVGAVAVTEVFSLSASLSGSTGEIIQMIKVPAGAQVTYLAVNCRLAGVGSIRVGDGVSTNRYILDTAASISAGFMVMNNPSFVPYTYSTDDTIDITVSQSVTFSAGSAVIIAHFTMDA